MKTNSILIGVGVIGAALAAWFFFGKKTEEPKESKELSEQSKELSEKNAEAKIVDGTKIFSKSLSDIVKPTKMGAKPIRPVAPNQRTQRPMAMGNTGGISKMAYSKSIEADANAEFAFNGHIF